MSGPALKPSQRTAPVAVINPVSQAAGSVSTGWIDAAKAQNYLATVIAGVLGAAATVDAKIQQATDNAGTGAKDVVGKAITQLVKATDDNKVALINFKQDDLDVNNNFRWVRLTITVGAAASLVTGVLQEFDPRYGPADLDAAAAVKEIVG